MAAPKKPITSFSKTPVKAAPAATSSTPVRNTVIPKASGTIAPKPQSRQITYEMIAKRAYEISRSPNCGSQDDNWFRAERELRGA